MRRRVLWTIALAALTLGLAACSGSDLPQDTFDPAADTAQKQKDILIPVLWVAAAVFIVVEGGIVLIAIKYRHRRGHDRIPAQIHGNTRLEIGWTIAPAVVLAFVMVPTISLIWELAERPPDAMHVSAKGYQWWWGFEYTDPEMAVTYGSNGPIVTANVMVVPLGRTVDISVEAAGGLISGLGPDGEPNPDFAVIHSLWAPRLFGKQDAVPGKPAHIVFTPNETGTFWGQCAEFCGLQHGIMKFRIVVMEPAAFEAWAENQRQPAVAPTDPLAKTGLDLFLNGAGNGSCVACHAVGGTDATSPAGPDLTHFADPSRECFAGCNFANTDVEALKAWLRDPNAVKLGAKMPNYQLSEEEVEALTAYLMSLT